MKGIYEKDFQKFLLHTDEKKILFERISEEIRKRKVSSLLDIGAGDGFLSVPLSRTVDRYLAIERSPIFIKKLRDEGLEVIPEEFPCKVRGKFDMVLVSHSLPEKNYKEFVNTAWEAVSPGGTLLIITHREKEGEWGELLQTMGEVGSNFYTYAEVKSHVELLGETEVKKFTSHVYSREEDEVLESLSFVFSEGDEEKKKRFMRQESWLRDFLSDYKKNEGIFFPFNHFFITCVKKK